MSSAISTSACKPIHTCLTCHSADRHLMTFKLRNFTGPRCDIPHLYNRLPWASNNSIIVDHCTHIDNFWMTLNWLEQVNLEVLAIGVVVNSMSNVHDVDWIIRHGNKAVWIRSCVAHWIQAPPTYEIYVVRRRQLEPLPWETFSPWILICCMFLIALLRLSFKGVKIPFFVSNL